MNDNTLLIEERRRRRILGRCFFVVGMCCFLFIIFCLVSLAIAFNDGIDGVFGNFAFVTASIIFTPPAFFVGMICLLTSAIFGGWLIRSSSIVSLVLATLWFVFIIMNLI